MKLLLLGLFVAAVTALPVPDEDGNAVEMIVNGVPEGQPLEISNIVDIKMKEHADGEVVETTSSSATDLLHPYTVVGLAEPAIANKPGVRSEVSELLPEVSALEVIIPELVVIPSPAVPEVVVPETVVLPSPAFSEVVVSEPVGLPSPTIPEVVVREVIVAPEEIPIPSPQFPEGDLDNDGSVSVNGPEEPGMMATLQSWFNMVVNYFSDGIQSSHQII